MKSGREKLVGIVTKNQKRRGRYAVHRENLALHEKPAEQDRAHQRGPHARGVESGDGGVKEERWDDQGNGPSSRHADGDRDDPKQLGDNGHVQSRNGKKVQRSGLLKLFLDFIRRLITRAKHHPADQAMDFRRIFQPARQGGLHPITRLLRGPLDWVSAGMAKNAAILSDIAPPSHDKHLAA